MNRRRSRLRPVAALLLLVAAGLAVAAGLPARPAAAQDPPGAVPFEVQLIPAGAAAPRMITGAERDGVLYFTASDFCILFDAEKFWRSDLGRMIFVLGNHEITVTAGTDLATVDKDLLHLPGPAFLWGGELLVPLRLFLDDDGKPRPWVTVPLSFSREERRLEVAKSRPSVSGASIENEPAGWRLTVESETPFRVDVVSTSRTSFVVRIPGLGYDPLLYPLPAEHRWFQGLRLRNLPEGLEVSFTPGPGAVGFHVSHRPETRLEILLGVDERDLRLGKIESFAVPPRTVMRNIRVVALDPGHGGVDKGANLKGGAEADLAWTLCRLVSDRLEGVMGVESVTTRGENEAAGLQDRAEVANRAGADLFLSFHFHLRPGGPQGFVADVERDSRTVPAGLASLGFRPFGEGQAPYLPASRLLARSVQDAVAGRLGVEPMGVASEPLPELAAAAMPAMILEMGNSPAGPWTQDRLEAMANGVIEGIRLFLVSRESGR